MTEYGTIKWYEYGSISACMAVARQNVPCCKGHQLQMFRVPRLFHMQAVAIPGNYVFDTVTIVSLPLLCLVNNSLVYRVALTLLLSASCAPNVE